MIYVTKTLEMEGLKRHPLNYYIVTCLFLIKEWRSDRKMKSLINYSTINLNYNNSIIKYAGSGRKIYSASECESLYSLMFHVSQNDWSV